MELRSATELTALPARQIARLVNERRVSPVSVVKEHLDRIAALEPALRAFQEVLGAQALADAEVLAARPDLGELPLAGVPVAVKDNVDVRGVPTRHGSAATDTRPAGHDDELVARLRAAGCVVIGKTRMPELAIWPFTEPEAFPSPRNPWDPGRTPGGSTGGGAVAVASGMAGLALGSDGGGSVRVPAACCGLFGLKPTPGLVPLPGGVSQHWYGLTASGPLARSVADAALALDVLAGTGRYRDLGPPSRPLRVAWWGKHPTPGAAVAAPIRRAVEEAAGLLASAGHQVRRARPPYPPNLGLRFSSRWLAGIAQDAAGLPAGELEHRTQRMVRRGQRIAHKVKPAAQDPFSAQMAEWFAGYDLLLTPTLARSPVPVGKWRQQGWVRAMLGVGNWIVTLPWNLAGLPAASLPFGSDSDGLPIGLQLVAPPGGEDTLLSVACQLERLRPWPPLAPDMTRSTSTP